MSTVFIHNVPTGFCSTLDSYHVVQSVPAGKIVGKPRHGGGGGGQQAADVGDEAVAEAMEGPAGIPGLLSHQTAPQRLVRQLMVEAL